VILATSLFLAGCGGGGSKVSMDTTTFDKAFQTAAPEVQALAAKASKAFKEEKFEAAANVLTEIASKEGLSQEQKDGFIDLVTKMQTSIAKDPAKSKMTVHQAIENAMSTLQGRPAFPVGVNPSSLGLTNK
jgi:hypothetical protein